MVVALAMFMVAAPLLTIPADAQGDAERQKNALMQFSDELVSCHAYCLVISRCLGAPKSAHAPADLSASQQYAAWAKKLGQLAFVSSRGAGRADDATSAFIDRVKQNVMRRIRGNCANIASIMNEDGEGCGQLAEHPSDRLEVLLDRNP